MLKILLITFLSLFFSTCSLASPAADIKSNNSVKTTQINEINLSSEFDKFNGTAVFYNPQTEMYYVHNKKLSQKRSSPCSTFKIFSTYVV